MKRYSVRVYNLAGALIVETWNDGETSRDMELDAALSRSDVSYVEWWPQDASGPMVKIVKNEGAQLMSKSNDMKSAVLDAQQMGEMGDNLLIAAGFLAGSDMSACAIAVLMAYQRIFGELDIPSNTLAGALIAKAKLDMQQKQEARREHGKGK